MEEIMLSIDCYQCGTKLEFPFRLLLGLTEYVRCPDCQEEIQVSFNANRLQIERLGQE